MYSVGKARRAFGLGRNTGGSPPAARVGGRTLSRCRFPVCPGCAYRCGKFVIVRCVVVEVVVGALVLVVTERAADWTKTW